jgi:hypothetical protein
MLGRLGEKQAGHNDLLLVFKDAACYTLTACLTQMEPEVIFNTEKAALMLYESMSWDFSCTT